MKSDLDPTPNPFTTLIQDIHRIDMYIYKTYTSATFHDKVWVFDSSGMALHPHLVGWGWGGVGKKKSSWARTVSFHFQFWTNDTCNRMECAPFTRESVKDPATDKSFIQMCFVPITPHRDFHHPPPPPCSLRKEDPFCGNILVNALHLCLYNVRILTYQNTDGKI